MRVPRESHFLIDLMKTFPFEVRLRAEDLRSAYRIITSHPRWRAWGVEDTDLEVLLLSVEGPTLAELIDLIYRRLNSDGKPRWGDKTPRYLREMRRLSALFPSAQFIHVIRDGRDVCISLRDAGWQGRHIGLRAHYWWKRVRTAKEAGKKLGPTRYLEVKYEDLVLQTEQTLVRVCEFLGEEYDERMPGFYMRANEEISPGERKRGTHAKTTRPPQPTDARRWERELGPFQTAIVEIIAGGMLDYAGYPRKYPSLIPLTATSSLVLECLEPLVHPARDWVIRRVPALKGYI